MYSHDDQPPADAAIAAIAGNQRQNVVILMDVNPRLVQSFVLSTAHELKERFAAWKGSGCRVPIADFHVQHGENSVGTSAKIAVQMDGAVFSVIAIVENTDDGLNLFYLSSDGETELQQSFSYDHLISCRNIYEEADGSLTCVGEMRIPTSDDRVQEKLFILHFPQKNKQPA